jgi:outer membrane protein assembly factor BamB
MYGFDAATGAVRFKTPMTSQGQSHLAPVVDDGMVYTNGGTYGGLYAFKSTGEQVFTGQLPDVGMSALSLDAANVYAYVGDRLLTFDRKTGKQVGVIADASTKAYGNIDGAAVIGAAGEAFAANYGATVWSRTVPMNELLRFDLQKGTIGWRVAGNYPLGPAYQGGTLYAVNIVPYRLEARAASDGTARWTWTPPVPGETAWSSEPVVTNNMLFVSTDMATYAIDLRSHKTVWSYPAAGRLALTQSGILYIQNTDGIVAINVK